MQPAWYKTGVEQGSAQLVRDDRDGGKAAEDHAIDHAVHPILEVSVLPGVTRRNERHAGPAQRQVRVEVGLITVSVHDVDAVL